MASLEEQIKAEKWNGVLSNKLRKMPSSKLRLIGWLNALMLFKQQMILQKQQTDQLISFQDQQQKYKAEFPSSHSEILSISKKKKCFSYVENECLHQF